MTFTFKLARRLARLRSVPALLLPVLAACAAGEPTSISSDPPADPTADGPVALSPREVTLEGTQHVLFQAFESLIPGSSQVTSIEWTATGGMIAGDGNYTSSSTGAFKIVGRRKGNPHNVPDTAVVIVVPPQPTVVALILNPTTATVGGGLQQQFTVVGRLSDGSEVPVGVTWTTTGGTIDQGGLYTATRTAGTYRVIAKHATTGLADTAVVTVPAATLTSIVLTPSSVSLGAGGGQQFSATAHMSDGTTTSNVPVAYSETGGSISVTGYYTAGSTSGSYKVIATAAGGKADTSTVSISGSTSTGSVWYQADFESGAWPSNTTFEQCVPGRIKVYSNTSKPAGAPTARLGTFFVGYTVLDSDVSPCTPTSNPRASGYRYALFYPGDEVWESFSVYFPAGFPSVPYFLMFQEDYGAPFNSPPPNGIWLQNYDGTGNRFYVTGNYDGVAKTVARVWSTKVTTGVWHDWMVHKRFATDKSGWLEVWFDGQQVTFSNGSTRLTNQQTMLTGATSANFGLLQYRSAGMFPVSSYPNGLTIYFDEARVGTTRESVQTSALLASAP
jgi:hypothetical protein